MLQNATNWFCIAVWLAAFQTYLNNTFNVLNRNKIVLVTDREIIITILFFNKFNMELVYRQFIIRKLLSLKKKKITILEENNFYNNTKRFKKQLLQKFVH